MKKFLCVLLALCALCGSAAFVGCKDGGKGSEPTSSRHQDNGGEIPEGGGAWNPEWN